MLGKLIKHEWKSTYKMCCLLLAAIALITFFGWLAFQSPMWKSLSGESISVGGAGILDVISILTLILYVLLLVGVNYGIMIYLGVHFYKTMYTDEGYLTHTLPVTKHQILGSKILVSSLWIMIILFAVYLSVFALGAALIGAIVPEDFSIAEVWREISPRLGEIFEAMKSELGLDVIRWLIYVVVMMIITPFTTIAIMFGAISMGQLFPKYRAVMAIVCYMGVLVVSSLLGAIIQGMISIARFSEYLEGSDFGLYMNTTMDVGFFINLAMAVGLYFVAYLVNTKRLNME